MSFEDAYESLTDHDDDTRWAYGTGFTDPLAGVAVEVPSDVDPAALAAQCLGLGDDALVMSHRLQQWVTRAPELEDELALANIGLDLLGQARLLLTRAASVRAADGISDGASEDTLAYLRDASGFRNVRLAERADDDFAHLTARLLAFSTWRLAVFGSLTGAADPVLAAIAAKGINELAYHREYAAGWVVRLGDGTPLSHRRMQAAVDVLWPLLGELRQPPECTTVWDQVLTAATLRRPADVAYTGPYGRDGDHTAALTELLDEMQGVARSLPGGVW